MLNVIAIMFYIIIEVDVPILGLDLLLFSKYINAKSKIYIIIIIKYKIDYIVFILN